MNLIRLCCFLLFTQIYSQDIRINELVASNSIFTDEDGDTPDWIELYNGFDTVIDLDGFYLSDKIKDSTKWAFPIGSEIQPKSYLTIWADGLDTAFHANFKLSKSGGEIAIFSNSKKVYLTPTPSAPSTSTFASHPVLTVKRSLLPGFCNNATIS